VTDKSPTAAPSPAPSTTPSMAPKDSSVSTGLSQKNRDITVGVVVGIGGFFLILFVALASYCLLCKGKKEQDEKVESEFGVLPPVSPI
jgi:hypothetical protein